MSKVRTALVLAFAMSSALLPGHARAELPVVASGSAQGASWIALKLRTAGSTVRFDFAARKIQTPNFIEIFKYDEADRFLGGFGVGSIRYEGGVSVDVNAGGGVAVHHDDSFANGHEVMEWSPDVFTLDGITKLLVWSSGPQEGWTWALRGDADVVVEATTQGTGSYAFMSHDMTGVADVRAHDPVFAAYGARASASRSKTIDVDNTLVGFYLGGNSMPPIKHNVLTMTGPAGEQLCYPGCDFSEYAGGLGPGTYTFTLAAGMGAVWSGADDILAVAVDARLPS